MTFRFSLALSLGALLGSCSSLPSDSIGASHEGVQYATPWGEISLANTAASRTCCDSPGNIAGADPACLAATRQAIVEAIEVGNVFVPSGEYCFSGGPINIPSQRTLRGAGSQSLIRRSNGASGTGMFRIPGTDEVTITKLAFDLRGGPQFSRVIEIRLPESFEPQVLDAADPVARNIRIDEVYFFDTNPEVTSAGDRWAISLGEVDGIWITNNRLTTGYRSPHYSASSTHVESAPSTMQFLANGAGGVRNAFIEGNYVEFSRASGIALSTTSSGSSVLFENVTIANNTIRNPKSMGIAIGPDAVQGNVTNPGTFRNIRVTGNTISWDVPLAASTPVYGVYMRAGLSRNYTISDNVVSTSVPTGVPGAPEVHGLRLESDLGTPGSRWFEGVVIDGNSFSRCRNGVELSYVRDLSLTANRFTEGGGVTMSDVEHVVVSGNALFRPTFGFQLRNGSVDVSILSNVVSGLAAGSFSAAFWAQVDAGRSGGVQAYVRNNRFVGGTTPGASAIGTFGSPLQLDFIDNDMRSNTNGLCWSGDCRIYGIFDRNLY